jgi:hypothetical protein
MASDFITSESAVADQQVKFPTSHSSKTCESGCTDCVIISNTHKVCRECEQWHELFNSIEEYEEV